MRNLMTLALTSALLATVAGESNAQFSLSLGNPYYGQGIGIGSGGYPSGYSNGFTSGYSSGYGGLAGPTIPGYYSGYNGFSSTAYVASPGVYSYNSGYRGYAQPVVGYGYPGPMGYGYVNRPYNGNFRYGMRNGFQPFRGANSWLR